MADDPFLPQNSEPSGRDQTRADDAKSLQLIEDRVKEILDSDPGLLFSHLYRLDVEESVLKTILHNHPPELWPEKLAQAIWERQKLRLESKKGISVPAIREKGWEL